MKGNIITSPQDQFRFTFAGKAVFTIVDTRSTERITFKIRRKKNTDNTYENIWWISAQEGKRYKFAGTVFGIPGQGGFYSFGKNNKFAKASRVISYLRALLEKLGVTLIRGKVIPVVGLPAFIEFWHEGICGCCGKALTVPLSIRNGLGPVCAARLENDPNTIIRSFQTATL